MTLHTETGSIQDVPSGMARHDTALRFSATHPHGEPEACLVAVEQPLTITIDDAGSYTVMCTPLDTVALAIGFALSEGLITSRNDIDILYHCDDDPTAIRMRLGRVPDRLSERNLIVSSSCGLCGAMDVAGMIDALPSVTDTLRLPASRLQAVFAEMKTRQAIFSSTGGTHAAAIFDAEGEIHAFAEDLGRHNALDKCIGKCCLAGHTAHGCGVALSGRVSLEMIVKAARAGIELIAAVSAPSSLALEAAGHCGISLCGFVRGDRLTAFTHHARIQRDDT